MHIYNNEVETTRRVYKMQKTRITTHKKGGKKLALRQCQKIRHYSRYHRNNYREYSNLKWASLNSVLSEFIELRVGSRSYSASGV